MLEPVTLLEVWGCEVCDPLVMMFQATVEASPKDHSTLCRSGPHVLTNRELFATYQRWLSPRTAGKPAVPPGAEKKGPLRTPYLRRSHCPTADRRVRHRPKGTLV